MAVTHAQYVWSPVYVDALVLRDRDPSNAGTLTEHLYVQQDANFNVTALVNTSGTVVERYVYDPYGTPTVYDGNWSALASSAFAWLYLHQGGRYELQTGLYSFRNREYSPTLGRFVQRDPIGFAAGDPNLYRFVGNNPANATDPSGLGPILPGQPLVPPPIVDPNAVFNDIIRDVVLLPVTPPIARDIPVACQRPGPGIDEAVMYQAILPLLRPGVRSIESSIPRFSFRGDRRVVAIEPMPSPWGDNLERWYRNELGARIFVRPFFPRTQTWSVRFDDGGRMIISHEPSTGDLAQAGLAWLPFVSRAGGASRCPAPGRGFTPDQQALQQLVNDATRGGRVPLSAQDAQTVMQWAREVNYPGFRASAGDLASPSNWTANPVPHIHLPGVGRGGHVPVAPGLTPP